MLSLVEEAQALQSRFDKSKADIGTIFSALQSGTNLSLAAVTANVGKWSATTRAEGNGLWIEWAMEGEGLFRGDRLLEANGTVVCAKSRDDLQRILGTSGKCQLVVLRRKMNPAQHQQLIQTQEDNMRLQHRISYLEEQVKDLLESKEAPSPVSSNPEKNPHVTSINITSPPVTPPDKPEVYQRGNFIMTIVGGKPVKKPTPIPISSSSASSASSASSVSSQRINGDMGGGGRDSGVGVTSQRTSAAGDQQVKPEPRHLDSSRSHYDRNLGYSQRQQQQQHHHQQLGTPMPPSAGHGQSHQQMHSVSRSISASSISINSEMNRREKERREREKELRREIRDRFIYKSRSGNRLDSTPTTNNNGLAYSRSGDQLHMTR